jgi:hypothetical protein
VLIKALIAHGATWGPAAELVEEALQGIDHGRSIKDAVARVLGYGGAEPERALTCDDNRVTAFYAAAIEAGVAHTYELPLPPSLASQAVERRLTATLAWLTPTNPRHRMYRRAAVAFDPPTDSDSIVEGRDEADWQSVRRGTLQHKVLRGHRAVPFLDGDQLSIVVSCRAAAGELQDSVRYALVLTLEAPVQLGLPIYDEVRNRLRERVPVRPRR